jgi:hypothetical protein
VPDGSIEPMFNFGAGHFPQIALIFPQIAAE